MTTKTKVPVIGSIVKYFDIANQRGELREIVTLPQARVTPSGYTLPAIDYGLKFLDGDKVGEIVYSDLRQSGWSILDKESQTWLQVNWEG